MWHMYNTLNRVPYIVPMLGGKKKEKSRDKLTQMEFDTYQQICVIKAFKELPLYH